MCSNYGGKRRRDIKLWGVKIDLIYSAFPSSLWSSGKILDVGSGHGGRGLSAFFKKGVPASNCTAVDVLKDKLLPLAEAGCNCVQMDLEKEELIDRTPGPFDIIICSHLFEHVTKGCESRLINTFGKIGSNVAICYPEKPVITKKSKRENYMHRRRPSEDRIVEVLEVYFNDVSVELKNSQIFIIAKDKKNE